MGLRQRPLWDQGVPGAVTPCQPEVRRGSSSTFLLLGRAGARGVTLSPPLTALNAANLLHEAEARRNSKDVDRERCLLCFL